jgi:hypothetical protein
MNDQSRRGAGFAESSATETCSTCGGDRRIGNSFGLTTTCPSCHGSGRRAEDTGFHDVTKTKPSHYGPTPGSNRAQGKAAVKSQWPVTFEGGALATQVRDSTTCSADAKAKLIREIIDHEGSHGTCTQTFIKKVRKQVRPGG